MSKSLDQDQLSLYSNEFKKQEVSKEEESEEISLKKEFKEFENLQKRAERGDKAAQFNLALLYEKGNKCVSQNLDKAIKWYQCAADQGVAQAQFNLALIYKTGKVTKQNQQKAIELYEDTIKNAKEEYLKILAHFELSQIYKDTSNLEKAVLHLKEITGDKEISLSYLLEKIDGVSEENREQVVRVIQQVAQYELMSLKLFGEQKRAKEELESTMSMFAHKFRSPLQGIRLIEEKRNNPEDKRVLEEINAMASLLNIFSVISSDEKKLKEQLLNDFQGESNLIYLLEHSLANILANLLTEENRDKLRFFYLKYAKENKLVAQNTDQKTWRKEHHKIEKELLKNWKETFSPIFQSPSLEKIVQWIETYFAPIKIQGFNNSIIFQQYGTKESILQIILPEICLNAIKYYESTDQKSINITWEIDKNFCHFVCENPTTENMIMSSKGSGKGHSFLSILANKLEGKFVSEYTDNNYQVTFSIPRHYFIKE